MTAFSHPKGKNSVYIWLVKIFTLHIQMMHFPSDRALRGISSSTYYAAEMIKMNILGVSKQAD